MNEELIDVIEEIVTGRGPISVAEVLTALKAIDGEQFPLDEDDLRETMFDELGDDFLALRNDRWASLDRVSDERVFTHRLTSTEIDLDAVAITPDLELLGMVESPVRHLRLTDGGRLLLRIPRVDTDPADSGDARAKAIDPEGSALLPPGTLAELGARTGDLLGVRFTEEGIELSLTGADDLTPHPDAVRRRLTELGAGNQPAEAGDVLTNVLADVDEAFREPHPPFGDLLTDLGIARDRSWLARGGFDFAAHWVETQSQDLIDRYELNRDEALSLLAVITVHRHLVERTGAPDTWSDDDPGLDAAVPLLKDPHLANALFLEILTENPDGASELILLTEHVEGRVGRSVRPALRWLRAKAHQWLGRISESESHLLEAERLDPTWPLTLVDLARYASDRGDAERGLALLRRAAPYDEDSGLVELLTEFKPASGPTVGRNEPCWCGSGRKFKQCHLHKPAVASLDDRAAWLYQKAGRFLLDGPWLPAMALVAAERTAYAEDEVQLEEWVRDPLVGDAVLFEGGAFADFLEQRGYLLPEDERQLAEQWLLVERSLFEIVDVRPGEGLTARDLRSDDVHRVTDTKASQQLEVGQLICARIVPVEKTEQIFGGIEPVALQDRETLLALLDRPHDPEELVAFLTRRFDPLVELMADEHS